jgi:hypothetical protein
MEIKRGNEVVSDVFLQKNSFVEEEIMGNHYIQIVFLSLIAIDLKIGDHIVYSGNEYKIRNNETIKKTETSRGWEYSVTFYASQYELQDVSFFLHGAPERKKNFDYYNGTASQWLELIVENMNRVSSGWQAGSVIESSNINMSFRDKSCAAVLSDLVNEMNTEYWIEGKTISIGRREYASEGLTLGQGEGFGFKEITLSAVDETPPITVLYPYGSDKNITSDYGNDYLVLPGGELSLERNVDKYGRIEQSVQFENVFPKGEFHVSEKINDYTLKASDIDFDLTDCLINGVEVIVTFQNGGLAGYDLAIVEGSWDKATKQFKLKENEEENALKVPGDINFSVGDMFILTGIKMPQKYIGNAENKLLEEATKYHETVCEKRVQLSCRCDDLYFKTFNTHIPCGKMIGILSGPLGIDREIRCTKTKKYLENDREPYRYEIVVSDFLQGNGLRDLIKDVKNVPDEIEKSVNPIKQFTKRTWHDVLETKEMMFDPESDFFTEIIQPLAVHTAQLIVGTNSQQMNLIGVKFTPNSDNNPNVFKNTAGKLEHFTINTDDTVRTWNIPASTHSLDNNKAYYVYAKCAKDSQSGQILVTDQKVLLEQEAGYYHFWIGVLNTPNDNVRSWQPMYGYTEIAGQQITTGLIKDRLSRLVIDLVNAKITAQNGAEIVGKITFSSGSSGYSNLTDKPDLSVYSNGIKSALDAAEDASNTANSASSTASSAQATANAAAKVFYSVSAPTSGMKLNDLWVNGTDIYRYSGSSWVLASRYDVTETIINGGLITTGAITFGNTGGMTASGSTRIWAGAEGVGNAGSAKFRVNSEGEVYAKNSIKVGDANGDVVCGFSSIGTDNSYSFDNPGSIRIWAGSTKPSGGRFKVTNGGYVYGTQFITNGSRGRMDSQGFEFGEYSGSQPYAFLHTNLNPLLHLRSDLTPLRIQYNGGYAGTVIDIENTYSDNATFQLGYYRYNSETFGRPCITMKNPVWTHMLTNASFRNLVWDENSGKIAVQI